MYRKAKEENMKLVPVTCVAINTELHNSFFRKRRQNCADVDIYKGRS